MQQPQQFQSAETLDHVEEPAGEGQFSFDRFWSSPEPGLTDQPYQTQMSENPAQPAYEDAQMREGPSPSYSEQEYTRMEANPEQNTEYQDTDKEMQQEENRESVLQPPVHRSQDGSFGPRGGGGGSYSSMEQPTQRSSIQQTEEIDLIDLFGYYMSRLPLLIAAVVIGAMVSGLFTHYFIPNRYTAVSRMYMISASSDSVLNLSDLNLGASLSNDYVELMKSRPVVEEVIDTLGLEYTYEQVLGMIGLSVVNNTRIVKISATSTDPYEAMQISNEMARVSKIQLPKVMDAPAPTIVEEAVLPAYKSSPSLSRNVMMGAMLLLVLVLGVLTVLYLMDDTIKTSEDVEREFGIMPLTVIPEGNIEGLKKSEESKSERRMRYWKKTRKKKKKKKKK
ncbi:Wzz/FepE/Etk N-terminal domain-containing protein [Sarcina sp. DSM 11001]|uniref:YveK family protein n=1 Tax=Sarcina sp. DSM 11001 TaxID=1798184 RepID=UPI000B8888CF|nr:Wzz/FepE/Etk N-terminal domain-containing protein [Sarcina sp. DSM 11001]